MAYRRRSYTRRSSGRRSYSRGRRSYSSAPRRRTSSRRSYNRPQELRIVIQQPQAEVPLGLKVQAPGSRKPRF